MISNTLRRTKAPALSRNLSRTGNADGAWRALAQAAAALAAAASALARNDAAPFPPVSLSLPTSPSLTIREAVNEFLRTKARAGRSDRYLRQLRVSLASFAQGRFDAALASVSVQDIEKWLDRGKWSPRTRKGYLGDVATLFNFAVRRGYCVSNPAQAVELPTCAPVPPGIHSPAEVKTVLKFARSYDLRLCRLLAVRYFAGLRSSEAARLTPGDVGNGFVCVQAAHSKTRRRRLVPIRPALAAWLALGEGFALTNANTRWQEFTSALKSNTGISWPANVTRHSFCSYHLAHWRNAAETALEAGHSEAMLFAHYRELVTPDQAAEFWGIRPV